MQAGLRNQQQITYKFKRAFNKISGYVFQVITICILLVLKILLIEFIKTLLILQWFLCIHKCCIVKPAVGTVHTYLFHIGREVLDICWQQWQMYRTTKDIFNYWIVTVQLNKEGTRSNRTLHECCKISKWSTFFLRKHFKALFACIVQTYLCDALLNFAQKMWQVAGV